MDLSQCRSKLEELARKAAKGDGSYFTTALQALCDFSTAAGGTFGRMTAAEINSGNTDLAEFRAEVESASLEMQLKGNSQVRTIGWALHGLTYNLKSHPAVPATVG